MFMAILQPYRWLEKWKMKKHGLAYLIYTVTFWIISIICNVIWPFPYFHLFFVSFTVFQSIALFAEIRYIRQTNSIRALTSGQDGFRKANRNFLKFERSPWIGIIALAVVIIFTSGGLLLFGRLYVTPTLVLCLIYFAIAVYLSIVGYVQYIMLFVYLLNIGTDSEQFNNVSSQVTNKLPAEIDWLKKLTRLTHFYRTIFFSVGAFYIIAFWFYSNSDGFSATSNHWAYFALWGIIVIAIVITFPVVSVCKFRVIKRIVRKVKDGYINEIEREYAAHTHSETPHAEKTIFCHIFSTSVLASSDYPISNRLGTTYAFVISLIGTIASADTLMQLIRNYLI